MLRNIIPEDIEGTLNIDQTQKPKAMEIMIDESLVMNKAMTDILKKALAIFSQGT